MFCGHPRLRGQSGTWRSVGWLYMVCAEKRISVRVYCILLTHLKFCISLLSPTLREPRRAWHRSGLPGFQPTTWRSVCMSETKRSLEIMAMSQAGLYGSFNTHKGKPDSNPPPIRPCGDSGRPSANGLSEILLEQGIGVMV